MAGRIDTGALECAVDSALEATLDPSLWPQVLDALGEATASTGAVMFMYGTRDRSEWICSERCLGPMDDYLKSEWCAINPRLAQSPTDLTASDADFMWDERQARGADAFRQGFLRKYDMGWFAGTSLHRTDQSQVLISVERALKHGPFEADELKVIDVAFRRMRRAISLVPKLDARLRLAMLDGFEARRHAAIVIDRRGTVLHLNAAAQALLPQVFSFEHGRLHAANHQLHATWNDFLSKLLAFGHGHTLPPDPMVLFGSDGAMVQVRGFPLPATANALFQSASALLFLDSLRPVTIDPAVLQAAFELTAAEARLASALSGLCDLRTAAATLHVGYETARTHLKMIFIKTGARGQGELAALLARLR